MPGKERRFGEGLAEAVADGDHEFARTIGHPAVDGFGHRVEAETIADRGHHVVPAEVFPFDGGGPDGFGDHQIEHRFGLKVSRQAFQQPSDLPRVIKKSEQLVLHSGEVETKVWPVRLLPIVAHEPNMGSIRHKILGNMSRIGVLIGSCRSAGQIWADAWRCGRMPQPRRRSLQLDETASHQFPESVVLIFCSISLARSTLAES